MAKVTLKTKKKSPFKRIKTGQGDTHNPLIKPPRKLRATPKLTVKELFDRVDAKKREAAKDIAIRAIRTMDRTKKASTIIPADSLIYRIQSYSKHNRHIHNVTVFVVDGQPFSSKSKVIVDCSCSSHIYQCEYNLARRGNAFLYRSNGEVPMVNTTLTICKHTFVSLRYMVRQARYGDLPKKSIVQKKWSFARGT